MDTTARCGEEARSSWEQRAADVEVFGMEPVVPFNLPRWFSERLLHSSVATLLHDNDGKSFAMARRALGAFDARDRLSEIRCPTLVIVGADHRATPAASSLQIL